MLGTKVDSLSNITHDGSKGVSVFNSNDPENISGFILIFITPFTN
jgi:hypothetical protein